MTFHHHHRTTPLATPNPMPHSQSATHTAGHDMTERVEKITQGISDLLADLEDCSETEREAIGGRIRGNIRHSFPAYMHVPYTLPQPADNADGFQWLRVLLHAAATEQLTGNKGDA